MSLGSNQDIALARDVVLFNADALSLEEVAARAGIDVSQVMSRLDDPDLLALAEREAASGRLSGVTAQAMASAIRDKALVLLAGRLNEDISTRALLDVLNAVRPIATREDTQKSQEKFSLVINMSAIHGVGSSAGDVIDVQVHTVGGSDE
jgi:hypothetical protein